MQKSLDVRKLVLTALFAAMSILFGKYFKISIGDSLRISFENLPIILASLMLGPLFGATTGALADIAGCLMVGYSINPIVTLGAVAMGILPGTLLRLFGGKYSLSGVYCAVFLSHIAASMLIKSAGLYLYFGTPFQILFYRVPIYLVTALAEGYLAYRLVSFPALRTAARGGIPK